MIRVQFPLLFMVQVVGAARFAICIARRPKASAFSTRLRIILLKTCHWQLLFLAPVHNINSISQINCSFHCVVAQSLRSPFICHWQRSIRRHPLRVRFPTYNKKDTQKDAFFVGAGGGNRTHTVSLPQDFESSASASSTTPAFVCVFHNKYIILHFLEKINSFFLKNTIFFK